MQIFWSTNNIAMQNNNWFLKDRILLDMSKSMNNQLLLTGELWDWWTSNDQFYFVLWLFTSNKFIILTLITKDRKSVEELKEGEERKSNGFTLSFYASFFGDKFLCDWKNLLDGGGLLFWRWRQKSGLI